jgi:hypothetical protein
LLQQQTPLPSAAQPEYPHQVLVSRALSRRTLNLPQQLPICHPSPILTQIPPKYINHSCPDNLNTPRPLILQEIAALRSIGLPASEPKPLTLMIPPRISRISTFALPRIGY